jgi:hypothetical protein
MGHSSSMRETKEVSHRPVSSLLENVHTLAYMGSQRQAVEQRPHMGDAPSIQGSGLARTRSGSARRRIQRLIGGGTAGNERLTAATSVVLVVLLAVIGVTILRIRGLLSVHLFVGMLLVPPVLLKMGSTGYRFARYYISDPAYRRKGPPELALRLLAPLVVLTTVVVIGSGVGLLFAGPSSRGTLYPIHKASFVAWLAVTAVHVLGHLPGLPATLRPDYQRHEGLPGYEPGRTGRVLSLSGALVAGVVLAVLVLPEFTPWLQAHLNQGH